jgi:hypothetical protein
MKSPVPIDGEYGARPRIVVFKTRVGCRQFGRCENTGGGLDEVSSQQLFSPRRMKHLELFIDSVVESHRVTTMSGIEAPEDYMGTPSLVNTEFSASAHSRRLPDYSDRVHVRAKDQALEEGEAARNLNTFLCRDGRLMRKNV